MVIESSLASGVAAVAAPAQSKPMAREINFFLGWFIFGLRLVYPLNDFEEVLGLTHVEKYSN
jgi:hypothetical protein